MARWRAGQLEQCPELLVACHENEALRLLEVAKEHCPLAAPHILVGMLNVRLGKIKIP